MYYHPWSAVHHNYVDINLSQCRYMQDVHQLLSHSFDFPRYYGNNWSAFWDCLEDFCLSWNKSISIRISGWNAMPSDLQDACKPMREILGRAQQKYPHI